MGEIRPNANLIWVEGGPTLIRPLTAMETNEYRPAARFFARGGIGFPEPADRGLHHQKVLPQGQNLSIFLVVGICLIQASNIMEA